MATFAAADLGAQSGRVALGRFDGDRLEVKEVHRFPNGPVRTRERLSWDILRIYNDVLDGLRAVASEAGRVDSIAVDSWGVDFALLDAKGRLIQNPVHYRDARRARAMEQALMRVPARELYERTGIQLMPINTVFELAGMAAEADPVLGVSEALLLIPDLLHYWLCGERSTELTNATTTQCFDPHSSGWATDLLMRLDIPTHLLQEVVAPGSRLGALSADVAEETRLGYTEVIAVGTHDTASAVAAVPFGHPGSVFVSLGTWSLVGVELQLPVITDAAYAENVTNEGGVEGTVRVLRNVTGLWLIDESRRTWALEGHEYSMEELGRLADAAPAFRSFIDPNDPAFADPGDIPSRIRAFCAHMGQPEPRGPGPIVRCILESLALKHAQVIDGLSAVTGSSPPEIHIVGGGSRNERLCRWTANATGLPVLAGPAEATLLGNLLVQAMSLGEIGSLADARQVIRASVAIDTYEPDQASQWGEARRRFAETTARPSIEVPA
jgi:rhamnulokinase